MTGYESPWGGRRDEPSESQLREPLAPPTTAGLWPRRREREVPREEVGTAARGSVPLRDTPGSKLPPWTIKARGLDPSDIKWTEETAKNVEFVADTRVLTPRAVRVLGRAAQALRRHATVRIEIVGHLHGGWPLQYGRDPSSVRASEVKRVLVEHGVEAARIEVRSMVARPMRAAPSASG